MEKVLEQTVCHGFDAALLVIKNIGDMLYHMTSVQGYRSIAQEGFIRPNDGAYASSFTNSELCNCRELKAVSLWDLEHWSDALVLDDTLPYKCDIVLLIHRPAVFIGFARIDLKENVLYYDEIKRRCGLGGIIPKVEACHVGEIRLNKAAQVVLVDYHENRLSIRRKSGHRLTDEDLFNPRA
jgi:hypothetical protein